MKNQAQTPAQNKKPVIRGGRVQIPADLMQYAITVQNGMGYSSPSEAVRRIIEQHKRHLGAEFSGTEGN